jgi:hypothetical protein
MAATLDASVTDLSSDSIEYHYRIYLDAPPSDESVPFFLLLSGTARYDTTYPNGDPYPQERGCSSFGVYGIGTDLTCYEGDFDEERTYVDPGIPLAAQWITGVVDADQNFAQVMVMSEESVASSAGSRTYFSLPEIGTEYLPTSWRNEVSLDPLGTGSGAWVPQDLTVTVDYRDIAITERIDNVAPALTVPGRLAWGTDIYSSVKAYGSLADTAQETAGQRSLFISGVLLGVIGGLIPPLVAAALGRRRT